MYVAPFDASGKIVTANSAPPYHYTNVMPILHYLRMVGIDHPGVSRGFRGPRDIMRVGTTSVVTPVSSRHCADNVGASEGSGSALSPFQRCDEWWFTTFITAMSIVNAWIPCPKTHLHKLVCTQHCKTES